ncbi:MAG: hypothetical protein NVS1B7_5740 [Candidatus Saccharimonadales bacterium]
MAAILVIEPDRILGKIYVETLQRVGHTVQLCAHAQAAVDLMDSETPDIIILELQLIDHSGIEFIYELRTYSEWQYIPIIVHTMVPEHIFIYNDLNRNNLGIAQYLYKPNTNLLRLKQTVSRVLLAKTS